MNYYTLTWQQKLLQKIKRNKKNIHKQAIIATFVCGLLFVLLNNHGTPGVAHTKGNNKDLFTATFVGDMMFGRNVEEFLKYKGYGTIFESVEPYFKSSNYVSGNFEQPVVTIDGISKADKLITFKADRQAVKVLKDLNFTTVNLANNHLMDYRQPGLNSTLNILRTEGLDFVGAGENLSVASKISYKLINGIKVATLGFTDSYPENFSVTKNEGGVLPARPEIFLPLVQKAQHNADLVIVHMHWGQEYDGSPHPRQQELAKVIADAGADIIVGHHPHVLSSVEVYKNTVILYSLGNFVFDQGWSRTRESVLVQYKLSKDGTARVELNPIWIKGAQPSLLTGNLNWYRRNKIFRELTKDTPKDNKWMRQGDKIVFMVNHTHVLKGKNI